MIEGSPAIIKIYHSIQAAVYDQKTDQKNSGKAHDQLFSYGRSEEMFPGHMQELKVVFGMQKYTRKVVKKRILNGEPTAQDSPTAKLLVELTAH